MADHFDKAVLLAAVLAVCAGFAVDSIVAGVERSYTNDVFTGILPIPLRLSVGFICIAIGLWFSDNGFGGRYRGWKWTTLALGCLFVGVSLVFNPMGW